MTTNFKAKTNEMQRAYLFNVSCNELPDLGFYVKAVDYQLSKSITLKVIETENLSSFNMLCELSKKRYSLNLNFYNKNGDISHSFSLQPIDVQLSISLDWEKINDTAAWQVDISL